MFEFVGVLKEKVGEREGESVHGHWKIATYLLETVEMYPRKIIVDVTAGQMDRVAEFDALLGQPVKICFDIEAHEYNGRWFNGVRAFKAQPQDQQQAQTVSKPKAAPVTKPATPPPPAANINPELPSPEELASDENEDLPF